MNSDCLTLTLFRFSLFDSHTLILTLLLLTDYTFYTDSQLK